MTDDEITRDEEAARIDGNYMALRYIAEVRQLQKELIRQTSRADANWDGLNDAEMEIAEMTAARDEACNLADEGWAYAGDYFRDKWQATPQIEALRKVGAIDQLRRGK